MDGASLVSEGEGVIPVKRFRLTDRESLEQVLKGSSILLGRESEGLIRSLRYFWEEENQGFPGKYLLALVTFAFLLRFPLLFYPEVIHYDGAEYIRHAKLILSGDWTGGKAPPLYPALIAFAHLVVPDGNRPGS